MHNIDNMENTNHHKLLSNYTFYLWQKYKVEFKFNCIFYIFLVFKLPFLSYVDCTLLQLCVCVCLNNNKKKVVSKYCFIFNNVSSEEDTNHLEQECHLELHKKKKKSTFLMHTFILRSFHDFTFFYISNFCLRFFKQ